ncbi:MAG: valine--tRNA ligase [Bifidobacteriaceae bacterium]|jgi:valyl-tRNA synthetase|nr:valine--tRNA ligase [Bifidobacteriaceae bacterium]
MKSIPKKATVDNIEQSWIEQWQNWQIYYFNQSVEKTQIYSIDTPPPTVSGSLHIGHVFSYTHTDIIARYKRMQGFSVFYPMGFDDNGLPTERRVQNYYGVICDPSKNYQKDFQPRLTNNKSKTTKIADYQKISRQNFIELCNKLSSQDEKQFKDLWQFLGLSTDWRYTYQTIDTRSRTIAQWFFLENLQRGEAYQGQAPVLWDVTFQTAVAQAELEAREYAGHYYSIPFFASNNKPIIISTTRPELLISCVAVIAHPDDSRYKSLFGKTIKSPLFDVEVPLLAHPLAEIDKGTGLVMCCTFGDLTDVIWWRELALPNRSLMSKNGRLITENVNWLTNSKAKKIAQQINGKTIFTARDIIVTALKDSNLLIGNPEPTVRMTNFYEKGQKPLEIVSSRQWYIKNGGTDKKLQQKLLRAGEKLNFKPSHMAARYKNWVEGLKGDWLISRQRWFGVPFPIWYKINSQDEILYDEILTPQYEDLPIDPEIHIPKGYKANQRGQADGFIAEKDIMDTWATSSLTPMIPNDILGNPELFAKTYPFDLRPQGQDIIRTWLFSTIVRSYLQFNKLPWQTAALSGFILDPDRKKMSKSKGNVITPKDLLIKYSSDGVRYWAATSKLGIDAPLDEEQMKNGRKLATKILNASKFVLNIIGTNNLNKADSLFLTNKLTQKLDISLIQELNIAIKKATTALEKYDHAKALELIENFFWNFCDNYIELVKNRAYGGETFSNKQINSAKSTLYIALSTILKMFALYTPFVTEEAWSWFHNSSIHIQKWPEIIITPNIEATKTNKTNNSEPNIFSNASEIISQIRGLKTQAQASMKTPIQNLSITAKPDIIRNLKLIENDIIASGNILSDIIYIEMNTNILVSGKVIIIER